MEAVLSHFACYPIRQSNGRIPNNVALRDQFARQFRPANAPRREEFCTPTIKNKSPRADSTTHLLCYRITSTDSVKAVWITNQFEDNARFRVLSAHSLCLPTNKSLDENPPRPPGNGVDHFKCYSLGGGQGIDKDVLLQDQFGTWEKRAIVAVRLCNPSEKRVEGQQRATIRNPRAHLVCYRMTSVDTRDTVRASYRNQFGNGFVLLTKDPKVLCVPSVKDTVDPGTRTPPRQQQTPRG